MLCNWSLPALSVSDARENLSRRVKDPVAFKNSSGSQYHFEAASNDFEPNLEIDTLALSLE